MKEPKDITDLDLTITFRSSEVDLNLLGELSHAIVASVEQLLPELKMALIARKREIKEEPGKSLNSIVSSYIVRPKH